MRLNVLRHQISGALGIVGRSVSTRSLLPVLGNVLLCAGSDDVSVSATDLSIYVRCSFLGTVTDEGSITVPARLMTEFIGNLPDGPVAMELNSRTQALSIKGGKFQSSIKGIDAMDFPDMKRWSDISELPCTLDRDVFSRIVDRVAFAASDDASRPTMTGVEFDVSGYGIAMAATDGFRLSVANVESPSVALGKVIVPAKCLEEVNRIVGIVKPDVIDFVILDNRIHFKFGGDIYNVEIGCSLIDAKYPDYRAIIPKKSTSRFTCSPLELLGAVKVAMLFARDNANITRLSLFRDGERWSLRVAGVSNEAGDGTSEIDVTGGGEDIEISFDGKFLMEALAKFSGAMLSAELTVATRPVKMTSVGDENFMHVIMPMQPK